MHHSEYVYLGHILYTFGCPVPDKPQFKLNKNVFEKIMNPLVKAASCKTWK